jgi:hypothetical protein
VTVSLVPGSTTGGAGGAGAVRQAIAAALPMAIQSRRTCIRIIVLGAGS